MTKIYNNIEGHSYKLCMTKKTNMDIQSTKLYKTKTYNRVNSTRKMMKFTHNEKCQCDIMND